jgi:hypothetical protein
MKACVACAEEIKNAAKLCLHCGTLQNDPRFEDSAWNEQVSKCSSCFSSLETSWAFCETCGTPTAPQFETQENLAPEELDELAHAAESSHGALQVFEEQPGQDVAVEQENSSSLEPEICAKCAELVASDWAFCENCGLEILRDQGNDEHLPEGEGQEAPRQVSEPAIGDIEASEKNQQQRVDKVALAPKSNERDSVSRRKFRMNIKLASVTSAAAIMVAGAISIIGIPVPPEEPADLETATGLSTAELVMVANSECQDYERILGSPPVALDYEAWIEEMSKLKKSKQAYEYRDKNNVVYKFAKLNISDKLHAQGALTLQSLIIEGSELNGLQEGESGMTRLEEFFPITFSTLAGNMANLSLEQCGLTELSMGMQELNEQAKRVMRQAEYYLSK